MKRMRKNRKHTQKDLTAVVNNIDFDNGSHRHLKIANIAFISHRFKVHC
uniref:Uncharacterized protein n=1 Tax=Anguilla anguilla TaxID=7936 RepID=A0A0E9PGZ9_ANGAN